MDNKQHTQAANALIQWFNSQEIRPQDAAVVMTKVLAKIMVGVVRGSHLPSDRHAIEESIDALTLDLVHEINDRLYLTRPARK